MRDINMLPEEIYRQKDNQKKKAFLLVRVLIFIGILAVLYGAVYSLDMQTKNRINRVEDQINELADIRARKEVMDRKVAELAHRENVLSTMDSGKTNFFDLLASVEKSLPPTVVFNRQEADGGVMRISGFAGSRAEVADFAAKLNQLEDVENVWINSVRAGEDFSFEITFVYEGGGQQ
ncbi:PilN domain-containing protein [Alkalibacter saccharofermentans]|uniref:Tfp pilus assembly protein PilN n=1 Tax=Alkalibacter saccharofermentans DSM 14828 TaxID=1120975 RepID=A0A1M4S8T3_9FIRM|nr:PilN domain-containing protein [Alkalibacter saccharofermentans]SHE28601.1 Tfp pilus assembly protein PilN [Alkalibacter saccharofermentans DSM 14828]